MKNQLQTLVIILTAALFFTACEKDESPDLLSISGEVLVQDALTPSITSPLEDITVYLLNSPFTIDTTALWFTKTDVLDSTKTDANGLYKFRNLQVGNYEVAPVDTVLGYLFEKSANSDNTTISSENSQTDYTVNFSSPEIVAENSTPEFKFEFNNSGDYADCYIVITRKLRSRFLGMWWEDWVWRGVSPSDFKTIGNKNSCVVSQPNSYCWEYANEFKIIFRIYVWKGEGITRYRTSELLKTIDLTDFRDINSYNVVWNGKTPIKVSPTN